MTDKNDVDVRNDPPHAERSDVHAAMDRRSSLRQFKGGLTHKPFAGLRTLLAVRQTLDGYVGDQAEEPVLSTVRLSESRVRIVDAVQTTGE